MTSRARPGLLAAAVLAAVAGVACGSSGGGSQDAASDAAGADRTTGAGGGGGNGSGGGAGGAGGQGGHGAGGAGGAVAIPCPAAVPQAGASCTLQVCSYEDCAGAGRTVAMCVNGAWSLQTGACASVPCLGLTCQPGEICVQSAGGALLVSCVRNACGTGPLSCDCLQSSCGGACTLSGEPLSGFTLRCNTCPSGQCA